MRRRLILFVFSLYISTVSAFGQEDSYLRTYPFFDPGKFLDLDNNQLKGMLGKNITSFEINHSREISKKGGHNVHYVDSKGRLIKIDKYFQTRFKKKSVLTQYFDYNDCGDLISYSCELSGDRISDSLSYNANGELMRYKSTVFYSSQNRQIVESDVFLISSKNNVFEYEDSVTGYQYYLESDYSLSKAVYYQKIDSAIKIINNDTTTIVVVRKTSNSEHVIEKKVYTRGLLQWSNENRYSYESGFVNYTYNNQSKIVYLKNEKKRIDTFFSYKEDLLDIIIELYYRSNNTPIVSYVHYSYKK